MLPGSGLENQSHTGSATSIACALFMGKSAALGFLQSRTKRWVVNTRESQGDGEMQRGSDTGNLGRRRDQKGTCSLSQCERVKRLEERETPHGGQATVPWKS